MADAITILPATPSDVPVILHFIRGLAEYEKLSHMVSATEDELRRTLFGSNPAAEVLIARLDGRPVGFALYFSTYSTFLAKAGIYLEDLFVLPEDRGRGVGRALLKSLAKIVCDRGCGRLEWSVLDWNVPAIEFYRKVGAEILPDWRTCRMTADQIKSMAEGR